jgi:hypothetical protein
MSHSITMLLDKAQNEAVAGGCSTAADLAQNEAAAIKRWTTVDEKAVLEEAKD